MNAKQPLIDLATQVRRSTLEILKATPPAALYFAPPGTSNHIVWHSGHCLWLQDLLCIQLLSGETLLPADWAETFGMNCRPVVESSDWPSQENLIERLEQQRTVFLELLEQATDQQLQRIADPSRGSASVAARVIHGFHDEAKHSGEMYLLLKLSKSN